MLIIKLITVALLSDCLFMLSKNTFQLKLAINLRKSVLKFCSRAFGLRTFWHCALISLLLHENIKTIGFNTHVNLNYQESILFNLR